MITDPVLKWVVGATFTVTAVYWVVRSADRSASVPGRLTAALHVVMALAMLTMVWSELPTLPTVAGMAVFAGATVSALVLFVTRRVHRIESAYHVAMMATMVWMYAVMDAAVVGGTAAHTGHVSAHTGGAATNPGEHHAAAEPVTMTMQLPSWASYLNLTVGLGYLAVAAAWIAYTVRRRSADNPALPLTSAMHALMGAATAAMFLSYTG